MMNRLKQLRLEKGYTQITMQMRTGIDQSDYSKLENGKRYYTFEQCRRLALALETSMDYLAGLTDEKKALPLPAGFRIPPVITPFFTKRKAAPNGGGFLFGRYYVLNSRYSSFFRK